MYHQPAPRRNPPVLVRDRYEITKLLGKGNFSKVFLAKDITKTSGKLVAIKFDIKHLNVLQHEATILNFLYQRCSHSELGNLHIPRVVWFGAYQNHPTLVMPYYGGGTLADVVKDFSPMSHVEITKITQNILDIVRHIHELMVIHRDIKPDNFLYDDHGQIKLVDFGLATFYIDGDTGNHITKSQVPSREIVGSPLYASTNTHLGIRNTRRDDCLQIGYIALFMGMGGHLPWETVEGLECSASVSSPYNRQLYLSKKGMQCSDVQWSDYMSRCSDLEFQETPDYIFDTLLKAGEGGEGEEGEEGEEEGGGTLFTHPP